MEYGCGCKQVSVVIIPKRRRRRRRDTSCFSQCLLMRNVFWPSGERQVLSQCVWYLQSGEDAGLLGVGGVTSGAGDAAESFGFTVESISDAHHAAHLTGRWGTQPQTHRWVTPTHSLIGSKSSEVSWLRVLVSVLCDRKLKICGVRMKHWLTFSLYSDIL